VSRAVPLAAGGWTLRRANAGDYDEVVRLQRSAFAPNRELLGVAPLPLLADYRFVLAEKDVWLAIADQRGGQHVVGVLVLERRAADLMLESIATDPAAQGHGLGRSMLEFAEAQATSLGYKVIRLYTGSVLTHLIDWYRRHGFEVERVEVLSDRTITHMMKQLAN
jgi:ribosomal protein S18 acetylase RimI-like enzyme